MASVRDDVGPVRWEALGSVGPPPGGRTWGQCEEIPSTTVSKLPHLVRSCAPPRDSAEWVPGFQGSTTFCATNVEKTLLNYARRDEDMSDGVARCLQAARCRSSGLGYLRSRRSLSPPPLGT